MSYLITRMDDTPAVENYVGIKEITDDFVERAIRLTELVMQLCEAEDGAIYQVTRWDHLDVYYRPDIRQLDYLSDDGWEGFEANNVAILSEVPEGLDRVKTGYMLLCGTERHITFEGALKHGPGLLNSPQIDKHWLKECA